MNDETLPQRSESSRLASSSESASIRVHVALGSNLGDRRQQLQSALLAMSRLPGVSALHCSSVYETEPMGPADQPDYLNAVCGFDYTGDARQLLGQLQLIEREAGRQPGGRRWGERALDLDIVLFGQQRIDEADLKIPHVGAAERSFVLWPLHELDSRLQIPGMGAVSELCTQCPEFGIRKLDGGPLVAA